MMKIKAESQSRYTAEKLAQERKKNLLVLVYRHLISCGYTDAATAMDRECNVGLEKWELADNMDLSLIL